MLMPIKSNKSKYIPVEGDLNNLFERLTKYISSYDGNWINRIKPADEESINLLRQLSGIEKANKEFPEVYKIFLKYMGKDDGGLIGKPLLGSASVEEVIELYQDFHEYGQETLSSQYFSFFTTTIGGNELSFELNASNNPSVVESDWGEFIEIHSENFEKFLFQCAFRQYERLNCFISFSGSEYSLKKALLDSENENVFDRINAFSKEYNFKKAWFSDKKYYIGYSDNASFFVHQGGGVLGFITGYDDKYVKKLGDILSKSIGADID